MEFFLIAGKVTAFVQAHLGTLQLLLGAGGLGALGLALKNKAYGVFFSLALELAKEIVKQELDTEAERHALVDAVYEVAPMWVKTVVTKSAAYDMADKAFEAIK